MPAPSFVFSDYPRMTEQARELNKAWKNSLANNELTKLETFNGTPAEVPNVPPDSPSFHAQFRAFNTEVAQRQEMAKSLIANMVKANHPDGVGLSKAGVNTTIGFNFYDLRGPVRLLFPKATPMRNDLPRIDRVNDGYGTAATWRASRDFGSVYGGVSEGNRGGVGTPSMTEYTVKYKELGHERSVTYTAQVAGEGYADNLADEHLRGLAALQLQEEGMIWHGNSGDVSGGTGFRLGTAVTPTPTLTATRSTATAAGNLSAVAGADLPYTSALTTSNYVSACVVFLTAMGYPVNGQYGYGPAPTIAGGLVPKQIRINADSSRDTVNGGTSAVSAMTAATQITTGNLCMQFSIPAASVPKGVVAYAWYVDVETSNTAVQGNAKLAGITTVPFCYVNGTPTGTQTATAADLSTDCSYNTLDFSGLLTYQAVTAGAGWVDKRGGSLTSTKDGRVAEVEAALLSIYQQFQCGVDEIWGDAIGVQCLDQAIRYSGTSAAGFQFVTTRDGQGNILGGYVVSQYQSRYATANATGANAIPIFIHPMLPTGSLYFRLKNIPYAHSRAPYVSGMLVQRDYYSIEWPNTSRAWPHGTYVHEALAHEMPWVPYFITGIGTFVGS